jgi:hypothetical protein
MVSGELGKLFKLFLIQVIKKGYPVEKLPPKSLRHHVCAL